MAQRTQILYVDDIDGIDLSREHADALAAAIQPYIAAARKVPGARRPVKGARPARHDQSDVRAWARGQGIKISDRGRIPADVLTRYESAH
jgi:hypothetical protein